MDKKDAYGTPGKDQESTLDSPGFTQLTFYDEQNDSPCIFLPFLYFYLKHNWILKISPPIFLLNIRLRNMTHSIA